MPYLSFTNHSYSPAFLVASNAFFNSLTDEQQKAFREAALEVRDGAYDWAEGADQDIIDEMVKETNVEINQIDFDAFASKVTPVYEQYRDIYGDKWLSMIEEAR